MQSSDHSTSCRANTVRATASGRMDSCALRRTGAVLTTLMLMLTGHAVASPAGQTKVPDETTAAMRCLTLLPEAPTPAF